MSPVIVPPLSGSGVPRIAVMSEIVTGVVAVTRPFPLVVTFEKLALTGPVFTVASVSAAVTLDDPLKLTVHDASPVAVIDCVLARAEAVLAFPVRAPVKEVDETDDRPERLSAVPPSVIEVDPIVTELFAKEELGIFVSPAPEPTNSVAVRTPVLGLNVSALLVYSASLPLVAETKVG